VARPFVLPRQDNKNKDDYFWAGRALLENTQLIYHGKAINNDSFKKYFMETDVNECLDWPFASKKRCRACNNARFIKMA